MSSKHRESYKNYYFCSCLQQFRSQEQLEDHIMNDNSNRTCIAIDQLPLQFSSQHSHLQVGTNTIFIPSTQLEHSSYRDAVKNKDRKFSEREERNYSRVQFSRRLKLSHFGIPGDEMQPTPSNESARRVGMNDNDADGHHHVDGPLDVDGKVEGQVQGKDDDDNLSHTSSSTSDDNIVHAIVHPIPKLVAAQETDNLVESSMDDGELQQTVYTAPSQLDWSTTVPPKKLEPTRLIGISKGFVPQLIESNEQQNDVTCLNNYDLFLLKLAQQVIHTGAPHYLFQDVISWVKEGEKLGIIDVRGDIGKPTLRRFLDSVHRRVQVPLPRFTEVQLEVDVPDNANQMTKDALNKRSKAQVGYFDFEEALRYYLSREDIFGHIDNLCVNLPKELDIEEDKRNGRASTSANELFLPLKIKAKTTVDELYAGLKYQTAIDTLRKQGVDFDREFVLGILLYTDKTGKDAMFRYGMEPIFVNLGILKSSLRTKSEGWFHCGFLPDLDVLQSKAEKARNNRGEQNMGASNRNYQRCICACLKTLITSMECGINDVAVRIGPYVKRFERVRIILLGITGDGKNADGWSGRYSSHHPKVLRQFWTCDMHFEQLDDTTGMCGPIYEAEIEFLVKRALCEPQEEEIREEAEETESQERTPPLASGIEASIDFGNESEGEWDLICQDEEYKVERDHRLPKPKLPNTPDGIRKHYWDVVKKIPVLKARKILRGYSQHRSIVAGFFFNYGGDPRGIFGSLPVDPMHAFLLGVMKLSMSVLMNITSGDAKRCLDKAMHGLRSQRQSFKRRFPRTSFTKLTDLTMITANEWVGVTLSIVTILLLEQSDAKRLLQQTMEPSRFNKIVNVLETMLCFWAYYRKGKMWKYNDIDVLATEGLIFDPPNIVRYRIAHMLTDIQNVLPREEGHKWKLSKLHGLLHLPEFMSKLGRPSNFDAGTGERNLKVFAKDPARTAQMRDQGTFVRQVLGRVTDAIMVERALAIGESVPSSSLEDKSIKCVQLQKRFWNVKCSTEGDRVTWTAMSGGEHVGYNDNTTKRIIGAVRAYWRLNCSGKDNSFSFTGYSELRVPEGQVAEDGGLTFRCHPNYRGEGPWYDWVVLLRPHLGKREERVLAKIVAMVELSSDEVEEENRRICIVHSCLRRPFRKTAGDTKISRRYELCFWEGEDGYYPIYSVAKPAEIVGSSLVYEECAWETGLISYLSVEAYSAGFGKCLRLTDPETSWADEFHSESRYESGKHK